SQSRDGKELRQEKKDYFSESDPLHEGKSEENPQCIYKLKSDLLVSENNNYKHERKDC
ncbi:4985_t:CDS:1, partial [Cetraspora pellucida]